MEVFAGLGEAQQAETLWAYVERLETWSRVAWAACGKAVTP